MSTIDNEPDLFELKHMVMSFRVSELQVLLGSAGRNKSGRKHDLLSRALQLLKNECNNKIQEKVKELYLRRFPRSKPVQPNAFNLPSDKNAMTLYQKDKKKSNAYQKATQPPVHPNVRFKEIPFYDILSDALKASSLITRPHRECSRADFSFTLTEEQVRAIKESRLKDPIKRYQVQVQLRFCLLETTCDQKDFLPPNLTVQVNRQIVILPSYIPPSKAGVEPKRTNKPIDITALCRICDISRNRLEVCWMAEHGKNYAVCINIARPLSSETLLQRLKRKGIRNADHSKALIKEKLARDPDSEIATTSLKVSLLCPLGTMRMTLPIRPITCTHMQCFDAMLFLQMNERKPTWLCPVCDKPAEFSNLFIDGLFTEILEATSEREIIFLDDGKWEPVKPKTEYHSLCTPSKSSNTIVAVANISKINKIVNVVIPTVERCDSTALEMVVPGSVNKPNQVAEKSDVVMSSDKGAEISAVSPSKEMPGTSKDVQNQASKVEEFFKKRPKKRLKEGGSKRALDLSNSPVSTPTSNGDPKRKEPVIIDLTCDSDDDDEDNRTPSPPKRKDMDIEQDEIHSLSSTSPYRSDTASVHRDDGPPPSKHRRTPQDLTWDPHSRDGPRSTSKLPSNIFDSVSPSPRPSSYGHADDRTAPPARLHTPGFSLPGSRDNTPPLHGMSSLIPPAGLSGYPNFLDYSSAPDFSFPWSQDALRRMNSEHTARSSPYLINPSSSSHLYPPTTRSTTNESLRNYMSPYSPWYNPYSPLSSFLQPQDSDVIPID